MRVSRTIKSICVTVSETVGVDPEAVNVSVGFHNYPRTQQAAYDENVRLASTISQALLDAGIPKSNIETENLKVSRANVRSPAVFPRDFTAGRGLAMYATAKVSAREPQLKLFPKKVEREATVTAVFAIE